MNGLDDLIEDAWRDRREGRLEEAERGLRAAVEISRRTDSRRHLTDALGKLAHVMRDREEFDAALLLSEEAVAVSRSGGDSLLLAHAVRHLGDLHRAAARLADADRCYREALTIYRSAAAPDALDFANALRPAAFLKHAMGDRTAARELFTEARELYQRAGIAAGVDECSQQIEALQ